MKSGIWLVLVALVGVAPELAAVVLE